MRHVKKLALVYCLCIALFSAIYMKTMTDLYPEVRLSQQELYGKDNENLKDFTIEDGKLKSSSGDPWIEYTLDKRTPVRVIEIDYAGVIHSGDIGEVFDTDTWKSHTYTVKNGKILINYDTPENILHFRFDLTAYQSVSFEIQSITINSQYGLMVQMLKIIGILSGVMFCLVLYELCYTRRIGNVKEEKTTGIRRLRRFAPEAIVCILTGIIYYNIFIYKVSNMVLGWMCVSAFFYLFCWMLFQFQDKKWAAYAETSLFLLLQVCVVESLSGMPGAWLSPRIWFWNALVVFVVFGLLYLVLRRIRLALALTDVVLLIIAVANHYFYKFRANPLEVSDMLMAKTLTTVVGNYDFAIDNLLLFVIVLEVGLFLYLHTRYAGRKQHEKNRKRLLGVLAGSLCGIFILGIYSPEISYWNMVLTTQDMGYLSSFVCYAKQDLKKNKPEGYSRNKVKTTLDAYSQKDKQETTGEKPNIIVLMNEAFSDLPTTYGFSTDEDVMPYIHSLKKNTLKGNLMVSVVGGSTANTEFEFLTGNSMAFLNPSNVPYVQYMKRTQESLASYLKQLGYQTTAFHPFEATNYNRNVAYKNLGFDSFVSIADDLKYTDTLRTYISDMADVKDVIDIYEKQKEQTDAPAFIFNVTMQNHGDYNRTQSEVEITVNPTQEDLQYAQLQEYLSLIHASDEAFKKLTKYFKKQDEKTIILMFGDHQPSLDQEIYETMEPTVYDTDASAEVQEKQYTVPFVMWANYDIGEEDGVITSPGFLRSILMEKTGLPLSSYDAFLADCRSDYMAVNRIGYYDAEGKVHLWDDATSDNSTSLLDTYKILQYGNLLDSKIEQSWYLK